MICQLLNVCKVNMSAMSIEINLISHQKNGKAREHEAVMHKRLWDCEITRSLFQPVVKRNCSEN